MGVDHRRLQLGRHVVKRLVAQDAGVVNHDVDLAVGVDRGLHDAFAAFGCAHRVVVRHRLAARRLDLAHDSFGRGLRGPRAVNRPAEVVYDHERTALGQIECVRATKAAAGARHDCHFAVETEISHGR